MSRPDHWMKRLFSGPKPGEILRLGAQTAERWSGSLRSGFVKVAEKPLFAGAALQPECLMTALPALYGADQSAKKVAVLLESPWLPVILLDGMESLQTVTQTTAWMRHRFRRLYGSAMDDLSTWDVRAEHVHDRHRVLGHALPSSIRLNLIAAAQQCGVKLVAMTPAWNWAWQHNQAERRLQGRSGWWVYAEQDRLMLLRHEKGEPIYLNAAIPQGALDEVDVAVLADTEALRGGIRNTADSIALATWLEPSTLPEPRGRVTWRSFAAASNEPQSTRPGMAS